MTSTLRWRKKALRFIVNEQTANGSFPSMASRAAIPFTESEEHSSPFISYIICQLVGQYLPLSAKRRALQYCQLGASASGSYNYWDRDADSSTHKPYPDDLDDTTCALLAREALGEILSGELMGKYATLLTFAEQQVGGPYRTWIVPHTAPKTWQDTDVVVNANIAHFLKGHAVELPYLQDYLEAALSTRTASPYYYGEEIALYMISRAVSTDAVAELAKERSCFMRTPQQAALLLLTLLRVDEEDAACSDLVEFLKQAQLEDGSWPVEAFVVERTDWFSGSKALTTALCFAALEAFHAKRSVPALQNARIAQGGNILAATEKGMIFECETWPRVLSEHALVFGNAFFRSVQGRQVASMPAIIRDAAHGLQPVSDQMIVELGLATIWGWMAYTILDNEYDRENDVEMLPLAALLLRKLTEVYASILPGTELLGYFNQVMQELDESAVWELKEARFEEGTNLLDVLLPDWGNGEILYKRSFGHAIASVAVLLAGGETLRGEAVKTIEAFFKSYLIARQITDDMHDWEKDLQTGVLTIVNTALIKEMRKKGAKPNGVERKYLFWESCAPYFAHRIIKEVATAKKVLRQSPSFTLTDQLASELDRLRRGAELSLIERKNTLEFISTVTQKN